MYMGSLDWNFNMVESVPNGQYNRLRSERHGICLHYDGSGSDRGSIAWFGDPRCKVSYNILVLDDGDYVRIAPDNKRAWHAGRCKSSNPIRLPYTDANSAFYGIAVANSGHESVTTVQLLTVVALCRRYFRTHAWSLEDSWRIVSHRSEAVNLDGTRGRKTDPEGSDLKNPIMSTDEVRKLLTKVSIS